MTFSIFKWFKGQPKQRCNTKSVHGHDFEYLYSNKKGFERLVFFKCSVCGKIVYVDFTGYLIEYD